MVGAPVGKVEAAEAESVLAAVERAEQPGLLGHQHIAFEPRLETGPDLRQGAPHRHLGLLAQVFEARVEPIDELLFFPNFLG